MSGVLVADATVLRSERLSPSFVRIELGGDALADLGVDGPWWDQRIKLVVPRPGSGTGGVPRAADLGVGGGSATDWYATWCAIPEDQRGAMRTYTVRGVRDDGRGARLLVDVVLHPGAHGPGSAWAASAVAGDRVLLVGPRRGSAFGGIEFRPPPRGRMLLVADETAVPAAASILGDWPGGLAGTAYLEVPGVGDVLPDVPCPAGVELCWLPRRPGDEVGARVLAEVRRRLGLPADGEPAPVGGGPTGDDGELLAWETPDFSASGEPLGPPEPGGDDLHAWVAGESGWVKQLRRILVREHGVDRSRVAFMGYWRRGVAMKA